MKEFIEPTIEAHVAVYERVLDDIVKTSHWIKKHVEYDPTTHDADKMLREIAQSARSIEHLTGEAKFHRHSVEAEVDHQAEPRPPSGHPKTDKGWGTYGDGNVPYVDRAFCEQCGSGNWIIYKWKKGGRWTHLGGARG